MKLGLRHIRAILHSCGDPHKRFRSVHIAGTNGKGSTAAMIAAVLQSAGYRTGLYTSPHLMKFNERIRINGKMISDADLVRYTEFFRPAIDTAKATFFEATTAIAFKYFADEKVDVAVVETGLGGRLDATNVLIPEVSVITSIGKDHTQQLGSSLRKIAMEKGGIIKRGKPVVIGTMGKNARVELKRIAQRLRSRLITIETIRPAGRPAEVGSMQTVDFVSEKRSYEDIRIPLAGDYQVRNEMTAIAVIECLQSNGFTLPAHAINHGFKQLQRLTGIRGRFEILRYHPLIILDVGHNPDAVRATLASLQGISYRKLLLVFGVMKDKDYRTMIRSFSALRPFVFAVQPQMERALSATVIADIFRTLNCQVRLCGNVAEGVRAAMRTQKKDDLLLICGSHYVAGEALQEFYALPRRKSS